MQTVADKKIEMKNNTKVLTKPGQRIIGMIKEQVRESNSNCVFANWGDWSNHNQR